MKLLLFIENDNYVWLTNEFQVINQMGHIYLYVLNFGLSTEELIDCGKVITPY